MLQIVPMIQVQNFESEIVDAEIFRNRPMRLNAGNILSQLLTVAQLAAPMARFFPDSVGWWADWL